MNFNLALIYHFIISHIFSSSKWAIFPVMILLPESFLCFLYIYHYFYKTALNLVTNLPGCPIFFNDILNFVGTLLILHKPMHWSQIHECYNSRIIFIFQYFSDIAQNPETNSRPPTVRESFQLAAGYLPGQPAAAPSSANASPHSQAYYRESSPYTEFVNNGPARIAMPHPPHSTNQYRVKFFGFFFR